ncbi:MAG: hypothetical protein AAFV95_18280 [Bacteroidota bacterium]
MKTVALFLLLLIASAAIQLLAFLPWWSFAALCFLLGATLPFRSWNAPPFGIGFLSGCCLWIGATLWYQPSFGESLLASLGQNFGVPSFALLLCIGVLGGLLSGLAVYAGFLLSNGGVERRLRL